MLLRKHLLHELLLIDLAHGIPGNISHHLHDLGDLIAGQPGFQGAPHLERGPLLRDGRVEDDDGSDFLAPVAAGDGDDGGLGDLGEGEELALDFEGGDFFTAGLDDVGGEAALDEVQGALGPGLGVGGGGDGLADGYVAGFKPRSLVAVVVVGVGDECRGSGFGIAPVFLENGGAAEMDLAGPRAALGVELLARGDDVAGIDVHEAGLDRRQGPADAGVDAVGEGEPAGECHADFCHAVPLEEDVAVGEVVPGGFDRGGQRGGSGDVDAHVLRRDGFSASLLERRG